MLPAGIRDDGLEFLGTNIVSLDVAAVERFTIHPSFAADRVLGILQPTLKSIINRLVCGGYAPVTIFKSFIESRLSLALALAVQVPPLARSVLISATPFLVFPLEKATFRTHVVYSCVYGIGEVGRSFVGSAYLQEKSE